VLGSSHVQYSKVGGVGNIRRTRRKIAKRERASDVTVIRVNVLSCIRNSEYVRTCFVWGLATWSFLTPRSSRDLKLGGCTGTRTPPSSPTFSTRTKDVLISSRNFFSVSQQSLLIISNPHRFFTRQSNKSKTSSCLLEITKVRYEKQSTCDTLCEVHSFVSSLLTI
jgi:hypothetical protein